MSQIYKVHVKVIKQYRMQLIIDFNFRAKVCTSLNKMESKTLSIYFYLNFDP